VALTALDIYKQLPRTNCKKCGFPTCMAFAMQVAAKQKAMTDCPDLSEEAKTEMADASTPPMKLVKIGGRDNEFVMGQETVMFRHEEKFHHPSGIAVRIPARLSEDEAAVRLDTINNRRFERVGQELKPAFCGIEIDSCSQPVARVKLAAEKSGVPIILIGDNTDTMKACVEAIKNRRPLIYKAGKANIDGFAEIAAAAKVPLAVQGESLEELADLTGRAKEKGVEEMILAFHTGKPAETLRQLTKARRAALLKNFKPLGYPAMVEIQADSPESETVLAATFAAKYASIVLMNGLEPWQLFPIFTAVQDIYTDPQVPNTVEDRLYEIGNVNENSPLLFTTNFALTYFCVAGEVERSKIPAYLSVVETEGMGVLNAYAGDKISVEKLVKTLENQGAAEKVKHRKLIIPGLLPVFRAEIEDTSVWKEVIIGPRTAREIPGFLNRIWS
jgi:acetyl-CoA decarbonylase/synthase complex subunit gamma